MNIYAMSLGKEHQKISKDVVNTSPTIFKYSSYQTSNCLPVRCISAQWRLCWMKYLAQIMEHLVHNIRAESAKNYASIWKILELHKLYRSANNVVNR